MLEYDFSQYATKNRKKMFAEQLYEIQSKIDFKMSSRGWCYFFENLRVINKDHFSQIEKLVNDCRKSGFIPVDFVAEEDGRAFSGIEIPEDRSPIKFLSLYVDAVMNCERYYTPDWWDGEKYYIQIVVEKVDLKSLFETVCEKYHIPIATSKGWGSILQRAEYAKRFKEAEGKGLTGVLLYCGDFDPVGLKISDVLRKNLNDVKNCVWADGTKGYNADNLIVERFGLNYDFIIENKLTWIDNLITSSGSNLADPKHKHFKREYVQNYIKKFGVKKCEANAIVVIPDQARQLCENSILKYLGFDAIGRFENKKLNVELTLNQFREENGINETMGKILEIIDLN